MMSQSPDDYIRVNVCHNPKRPDKHTDPDLFLSVFVPPSHTIAQLKQLIHDEAKADKQKPPKPKSMRLFYQPEVLVDATTAAAAGAAVPEYDHEAALRQLKDDTAVGAVFGGFAQVVVLMSDTSATWRTTALEVTLFVVYMALNIGINLYNKWMFSVLNFRVPLLNLVVHQFSIFAVLFVFVLIKFCTGWGLKLRPLSFTYQQKDYGVWAGVGVVSALGLVGALNFGLTSVALMLLSQADLQIVRATIPFFVAISFSIFEGRAFSAVEVFFMLVTVAGVVIVVVFHAKTWHMDVTGLMIAVASNFAAAMHMSLYAQCKDALKLDAWSTLFYTVVPLGCFVIPFVFVTHEPASIEAFMKNGHTVAEIARVSH